MENEVGAGRNDAPLFHIENAVFDVTFADDGRPSSGIQPKFARQHAYRPENVILCVSPFLRYGFHQLKAGP